MLSYHGNVTVWCLDSLVQRLSIPSITYFFILSSLPFKLFSIVIFGCIANEGYINRQNEMEQYCIFNRNQNACNYGVFMGSMAFLCCIAFLALDVYFPQISSVKDRKKAVLADIGVSGKYNWVLFLFFNYWVFFCYEELVSIWWMTFQLLLKVMCSVVKEP